MKRNTIQHVAIVAVLLVMSVLMFSGYTLSATEDDYKARLQNIASDISNITSQTLQPVDDSDTTAKIQMADNMIGELAPLYHELASLNAPEKYKAAQEKIAQGAAASLNLLTLSKEILVYSQNPTLLSAQQVPNNLSKLNSIKQEFQQQAKDLTAGFREVLSNY